MNPPVPLSIELITGLPGTTQLTYAVGRAKMLAGAQNRQNSKVLTVFFTKIAKLLIIRRFDFFVLTSYFFGCFFRL